MRLKQGEWRFPGHIVPDVRCLCPCSSDAAGVRPSLVPGTLACQQQLSEKATERVLQENYLNHLSYTDVNLPCAANTLTPVRTPLIPKRGYVLGI